MSGSNIKLMVHTAEPERLISLLAEQSVTLNHIVRKDDICIILEVHSKQLSVVKSIIEHCGGELKVLNNTAMHSHISEIFRHPILVIGAFIYIILLFYLPGRILFVQVEGNSYISSVEILDCANRCGIHFGSVRRDIRSEQVKNYLLDEIHDLSWVGVNTKGCVATITVKEKAKSEILQNNDHFCGIYSKKDAVIRKITVTQGTPLCQVGDAVTEGQLLISGYTDCGIKLRMDGAAGEVYGETTHDLHLITPMEYLLRCGEGKTNVNYSLLVGKKLIKLTNSSRISPAECVKIKEINYLLLPGGFQLPIALICEKISEYSTNNEICEIDGTSWLKDLGRKYVEDEMTAGYICSENAHLETLEDVILLKGKYICNEMIGQIHYEEMDDRYGERNRTDRERRHG